MVNSSCGTVAPVRAAAVCTGAARVATVTTPFDQTAVDSSLGDLHHAKSLQLNPVPRCTCMHKSTRYEIPRGLNNQRAGSGGFDVGVDDHVRARRLHTQTSL